MLDQQEEADDLLRSKDVMDAVLCLTESARSNGLLELINGGIRPMNFSLTLDAYAQDTIN